MILRTLVLFILCLNLTSSLFAHSGGTKKSGPLIGCHRDKKSGGFHCHSGSVLNGKSFSSEEEALLHVKSNAAPKIQTGSKRSGYVRSAWPHWVDDDGDCLDTRQEIFLERSQIKAVLNKNGCRVISGSWMDYYYDSIITNPKDADIDHIVPLKHAHDHGAADWTSLQKRKFANDPENLVITLAKYNRQKGSSSITEWLPLKREFACKYVKQWLLVKNKYQLTIAKGEHETASLACGDSL